MYTIETYQNPQGNPGYKIFLDGNLLCAYDYKPGYIPFGSENEAGVYAEQEVALLQAEV